DSDGDGVCDTYDECPNDESKTEPGICGCGTADMDEDNDGYFGCQDDCNDQSALVNPGVNEVCNRIDDNCDGSVDEDVTSDTTCNVQFFVTRFYEQCLNRGPDPEGLAYWANSLLDGSLTGADVAWGFVFSQEFTDLNTTDEEYLNVLYRAFFDREPDSGGVAHWLAQLANGASREDVLDGFIHAQEFYNLSFTYGISPNLASAFVSRFYQECLSRDPDQAGLESWVNELLEGTLTGSDLASALLFSQEFLDLNTTNDEYIAILYGAFFDREPDSAGLDYWLSQLNSDVSREDVLEGFINTQEFMDLSEAYGITPF
ncbi:MAG: DUF4214 domain-containing protein, partial [bacterium]|nr:DUF4214 domain-containing protein [bacterium]